MCRIAVKIGSNVLTRADGTLDITRMSATVDQVADLRQKGMEIILISSGAVASGRSEIKVGKKLDPVSSQQLYSAVGQAKLINRYYELFREHGLTCGQVLATKENFGSRTHYFNQKHYIEVMRENSVIPIVNENDTISVTLAPGSQTVCTRFVPAAKPVSRVKKWIAHSEGFAKGELHINREAEKTLLSSQASSFLLVGVTQIKGDFEKDDIVRIINEADESIGVGCTNYSSKEARDLIGSRDQKPLVHYDYLYLDSLA